MDDMKIRAEKLAKVTGTSAASICEKAALTDDAKSLLTDSISPTMFFNSLIEQGFHSDAVQLLSFGLPIREAIWWGYMCSSFIEGQMKNDKIDSALAAIKKWCYEPNDDNRKVTEPLGKVMEYQTAASWLATSVFWSGGSITEGDQPEVHPQPHLAHHMVAGAINLAAVITEPEKKLEKYERFLRQGIEIANGKNGEI